MTPEQRMRAHFKECVVDAAGEDGWTRLSVLAVPASLPTRDELLMTSPPNRPLPPIPSDRESRIVGAK